MRGFRPLSSASVSSQGRFLYVARYAGSAAGLDGNCVSDCASSVRAVPVSAAGSAARTASRPVGAAEDGEHLGR